MAVDVPKAAGLLQAAVEVFEQGMFDFDFTTTQSTQDVMMILPRDLVGEMSIPHMGWTRQSVLDQELQRPVYGRLGDARQLAPGFFEYFTRRKMAARMMQNMQDRHPLGCHSEAA